MAKAKKKPSIEDQIASAKAQLQALRMKSQIDSSDHPKEAKMLLKAANVLRGLVDTDEDDVMADALTEIVREMCGIEEEEDDDE